MKRNDDGLAFLLKYENVAWYQNGYVRILDRRIYPREIRYVECRTANEVANAIREMVTQSGGPFMAATMGMVLAANESEYMDFKERISYLENCAYNLSHARPTTSAKMVNIVNNALEIAKKSENAEITNNLLNYAIDEVNLRYANVEKRAKLLVEKINDGDKIMTQCFADAAIGMICKHLRKQGKNNVVFYVPETRPYFQGSRLTASVIADMGFEVYVITDNMVGITMENKRINFVVSAADVITMDGHVINKVGTFNIALIAWYYGVPYYCLGSPNQKHKNLDSINIEERSDEEILCIDNNRYVLDNVKGYYPLFDVTPPKLISGIITEKGIFSARDLTNY